MKLFTDFWKWYRSLNEANRVPSSVLASMQVFLSFNCEKAEVSYIRFQEVLEILKKYGFITTLWSEKMKSVYLGTQLAFAYICLQSYDKYSLIWILCYNLATFQGNGAKIYRQSRLDNMDGQLGIYLVRDPRIWIENFLCVVSNEKFHAL